MELVEGEDLEERLRAGPIPLEETIEIARQIAEGLEDAHEEGIIHRDLKPANIKLSPDGKVKILDFGLARCLYGEALRASATELSHSPTLTRQVTQAGVILGTAAYMAPEQARGKRVDHRADIWSFGVVLFEMLTGERLFEGETVSDTLAAILTREPDLSELPVSTPLQIRSLLGRCLRARPAPAPARYRRRPDRHRGYQAWPGRGGGRVGSGGSAALVPPRASGVGGRRGSGDCGGRDRSLDGACAATRSPAARSCLRAAAPRHQLPVVRLRRRACRRVAGRDEARRSPPRTRRVRPGSG